jgi:two-component system response regulator PilR (NtrC family)
MVSAQVSGRVLVVDDEPGLREFLEICLSRAGHEVSTASSGAEAIRMVSASADGESRETPFDVVLTDMTMPGVNGMEVLRHCVGLHPAPTVLMMTAYGTADTAVAAMKAGARDYILKPFKVDEIQLTVARAMQTRMLSRENRRLREELRGQHTLDRMIARAPSMLRVFEMIRKVAPTRTNVLVYGESGTGKELVARALHTLSGRPEERFIAINCGAIPAALMESELFGHKKGSFTGATHDREGVFAAADGGTLFLDEIGELDLSLQVKLLRAVQERRIRPVGGTSEREVDVRVIAATNRDLLAAIEAKEFREDLYFRLNVVQISLPPLRHRREDIQPLADRFFERYNREMGERLSGITPDALQRLLDHDFPGNVRELENLIERAVALESGEQLTADHLPPPGSHAPNDGDEPSPDVFPPEGLELDAAIADLERRLIQQALHASKGVRREAARLLSVSERSLRYRISKLALIPGEPPASDT